MTIYGDMSTFPHDDRAGMRQRDYVAVFAMQSILANRSHRDDVPINYEGVAALAYKMADAMIVESERRDRARGEGGTNTIV